MLASANGELRTASNWLIGQWQWPMAALFAASILLLLAPAWGAIGGAALLMVWLQLPLYMIHQFEEHYGDRFRRYINRNVVHCEALTPEGAFWINSLGVWGVDVAMLYVAVFVNPALALGVFYLPIVNALTHVRESIVRRRYNPGLCTSLLLFLPVSGYALARVSIDCRASIADHLLGLGVAVAIHAAIIVYIVLRVRQLRSMVAQGAA
jgi:hypothetical protein